jgi:hypothetical protein
MNLTPDYSPHGQPARRQDQLAAIVMTAREPDGRGERLPLAWLAFTAPDARRYRPQDGALRVPQPDAEDLSAKWTGLVKLLLDGIESPHKPLSSTLSNHAA